MIKVTKIPRLWMMKRLQKDSLDRSSWRVFILCCICLAEDSTTWCSLPLLLVLTSSFIGCSSVISPPLLVLLYFGIWGKLSMICHDHVQLRFV